MDNEDDSKACLSSCFSNVTKVDAARGLSQEHNALFSAVHSALITRQNVVGVAEDTTVEASHKQAESRTNSAPDASAAPAAPAAPLASVASAVSAVSAVSVASAASRSQDDEDCDEWETVHVSAAVPRPTALVSAHESPATASWISGEAHSSMNHAENEMGDRIGSADVGPTRVEEDEDCEEDEERRAVVPTGSGSEVPAPIADATEAARGAGEPVPEAPTSVMTNRIIQTVTGRHHRSSIGSGESSHKFLFILAHTTVTSSISAHSHSAMATTHDLHRAGPSGGVAKQEASAAIIRPTAAVVGLAALALLI